MKIEAGKFYLKILICLLAFALLCSCSDGSHHHSEDGDLDDYELEPLNWCYENTLEGCTDLSWGDIKLAVQIIFEFEDEYYGYNESEALDFAKILYDNGVYPEAYLSVLHVEETQDGKWRAFVAVTQADGYPATDLNAEDISISIDEGEPLHPQNITTLKNANEDVHVTLSVVIDDSGSMMDCDLNFVSQGLAHLVNSLPPVYEAELIKFAADVYPAQELTTDGEILKDALLTTCTDRSSTSLWDAVMLGLEDVQNKDGFRLVAVLSDGLDNDSDTTIKDVKNYAGEHGIPVIAIGLGLADMFTLMNVTTATGGGAVYISGGEKTLDAFKVMTSFITESYIIEWSSESFNNAEIKATVEDGVEVSDVYSREEN